MPAPPDADGLPDLRATLAALAERVRELDRLCRAAAELVERLEVERAGAPGGLDERQGALLVAVTLRGGTVARDVLAGLAAELGVDAPALERLFAGAAPHLSSRGDGARLTDLGLDAAAAWRSALEPELLRRATEL